MIDGLRPYTRYRDVEATWLGEVPDHWQVRRCRYLFREVDHRSADGSETHLSMSQKLGLVPSDQVERTLTSASYAGAKLCERDDLVLNRLKAHLGVFARATQPGVISPDYTVLRPKSGLEVRYFEETLRSPACRGELRIRAKGIVEGFWRLYTDDFYAIRLPVPPPDEQAAIVRFLDHADRRIRRYILAKQKLIKLLEEQKQAIIHQAVTRGLDPSVPMKEAGEDWLGSVPRHWTVASLRFRYSQCLGKMVDAGKRTETNLVPYLRNVDVRWDSINTIDLPTIDIMPSELERYTLRKGDLLVCEGRHLGRCAFWKGEIAVCAFQKALHRLRVLNPETDHPRFMYYCLRLAYIRDAFLMTTVENAIPHLTGEMLRAHRFAFPPFEEQVKIVGLLDNVLSNLERAVQNELREVQLVQELRTRLIADVVTGQLDVRAAAAALPDEPTDDEPLDDADDDLDADAAPEDDDA